MSAPMYSQPSQINYGRPDMVQTVAPSALSPVQSLLMCQRDLLDELRVAAADLIDPLRSVLSHDPREAKQAEVGTNNPIEPPGCGLEESLMNTNAQIADAVERLHQIRRAIRL